MASVTVTYQPDLPILRRQLQALGGVALRVVVDNASDAPLAGTLAAESDQGRAYAFLPLPRNEGLAAGLNAGARAALERAPECEWLLFLDQDTEPDAAAIAALLAAADGLSRSGPSGLIGPLMIDADTGLSHGVHVRRGLRWARVYPAAADAAPVACASINGSGMLVAARTFREQGGFDEALFIDHVDTEYSFRLAAAGLPLHTAPAARFAHRMGQSSLRFWLGRWRIWPYRSPVRQFYLFRNAIALMGRDYVPGVWKFWALAKLGLTLAVHAVFDRGRARQLRAMLAGIGAGLRGEGGAADAARF